MAAEKTTSAYAAMVKEAEAAVAAVKDPELRRVAFERILAKLLEVKSPAGKEQQSKERARSKLQPPRSTARAAKGKRGPKGYIEELIEEDFFRNQRTIAEVKAELANLGHHIALTSLSGPLQSLTKQRKLRRQKAAAKGEGKSTYAYSNY